MNDDRLSRLLIAFEPIGFVARHQLAISRPPTPLLDRPSPCRLYLRAAGVCPYIDLSDVILASSRLELIGRQFAVQADYGISTGHSSVDAGVVVEDHTTMLPGAGVLDQLSECWTARIGPSPPVAVNRRNEVAMARGVLLSCRLLVRVR